MTNPLGEEAVKLLPCPFCGGKAAVEHVQDQGPPRWSVGCEADEESCMGFQSLTTFARRSDAIAAWNRRPQPQGACVQVEGLRAEAERCVPGSTEWRTPTMSVAPATVLALLDRLVQVEAENIRLAELAKGRLRTQAIAQEQRQEAEAERDAALHQLSAARKALEDAEATIERIAHPQYGLGFQKLRGLARAYQTRRRQALSDLKEMGE